MPMTSANVVRQPCSNWTGIRVQIQGVGAVRIMLKLDGMGSSESAGSQSLNMTSIFRYVKHALYRLLLVSLATLCANLNIECPQSRHNTPLCPS